MATRALILETRPRQPEAEALYAGLGYTRTDYFGHYPEARAFSLDLPAREQMRSSRR